MLLVMFSLLLLSVIGLGMMYSTNMESAINANYRDKQVALYASLGGLQEARDRIQPATHNIAAPDAPPSLTAPKVIYILADSSVVPWNTSNKYFDTELCQERVLSLTGTAGVPCTTMVPSSNTSWRTWVFDDDSLSAPWNLVHPIDVKWTRITMKANNAGPVPVNGDPANSMQVCWDGTHQVTLPAGYGATCGPNGSVASLTFLTQGTGYTPVPAITFSAPPAGGIQATADPQFQMVPNDQVANVTMTTGGTSYTSTPAVVFTGGGGAGAAATAVVSQYGSPVQTLSLSSAGTKCYAATPTVAFTGGGGTGASATAVLESTVSCVAGLTVSGSCDHSLGANSTVTIGLSGGGGSGFSGTATVGSNGKSMNPNPQSVTIINPGTGYTSNPTAISGACYGVSHSVTIIPVLGKHLQSLTLTSGGTGYTVVPAVTISAGLGSGATAPAAVAGLGTIDPNPGQVIAVNMTSSGSGYTSAPTVSFAGGSGSGAAAVAHLGVTRNLIGLTLAAPGYGGAGYLSDPTVTITDATGTGATARARIGRGPNYGKVHLITSLAETRSGARSMTQMEVSGPVLGFHITAALTLDGPNPIIDTLPNSSNFIVSGNDNNSCSDPYAEPPHPAIGSFDDPNASPPTHSTQTILDQIPAGRTMNYPGEGGSPAVRNVWEGLGETMRSPSGLKAYIDSAEGQAALYGLRYPPAANSIGDFTDATINMGTGDANRVVYVDGNLTLSGNTDGWGILVVTGTLRMTGNLKWHGLVLAIGDGNVDIGGGGNGQVVGAMFVAKIWDNHVTNRTLLPALAAPSASWNGGGNNGILYDHCLADTLLSNVPFNPPPGVNPLKVLSFRMLPY
ncbi:MAG: hypothetical protein DMG13_29205 [Acidobacteria bacterium]|nr:MAG: hypothetical protein DMG13_29205 [Acidobacteriota bacterium]